MTFVNVPLGGGRRVQSRQSGDAPAVEYWLIGVVSLLVTLVGGVWLYPDVVTATSPLRFLSTTALVFLYVFVWTSLWVALDLAWAWRT